MKYNIYDFDGTIYDGDSGVDFLIYGIKKYPSHLIKFPVIFFLIELYMIRIVKKEKVKQYCFSFIKKIDDVDSFVKGFWKKNEHKIYDYWKNQKNHKKDIIISASGYLWLEYIADKYKVYDLIATEYDHNSGKIIGNNCHGDEKVSLLYKKHPNIIINNSYTDSLSDLPILKLAQNGFIVTNGKPSIYNEHMYKKENKLMKAIKLVYNYNAELSRYLISGAIVVLINILVKWILLFTILNTSKEFDMNVSITISWIVAFISAFFLNKYYVFKSTDLIKKEFISFLLCRLFTLGFEYAFMWLIITKIGFNTKCDIIIITLITQTIIIVLNYILSKVFTFKKYHRFL